MKYAIIGTLLCALLLPQTVIASCYTGSAPGWSDVNEVELVRCQEANPNYPCYVAYLEGLPGQGIDGFVDAYHSKTMSGLYVIQHPVGSWNDVVAMLQRADFYHLELSNSHPPKGATVSIHVDGPRNQIIVFRCHRAVAVFGGDVYDDSTPAWTRFVELVGGLDKLVAKLPWKPRNTKPSLSNVERAFLP